MEQELKKIIKDTLFIDINQLTEEEKKYPLLSSRFNILPYQMLVFFTRVEEKFEIKIKEEDIVEGNFNCYRDILKVCEEAVNKVSDN